MHLKVQPFQNLKNYKLNFNILKAGHKQLHVMGLIPMKVQASCKGGESKL